MATKYEGIIDLILLETHDEEGNTHLSIKFAAPDDWGLPLTEDNLVPWLTVVKNERVIKAVKASADNPVKMTQGGNRYRFIGTFKVSGRVASKRFFLDSMVAAKADYFLEEEDGISLD